MHGIVCAKGAEFCQSAKISCTFVWFSPVAILISNWFQCVISQMKEDRFLIKFLSYYFWVGVIPFQLINLLLSYFFAHCMVESRHGFRIPLRCKLTRIRTCKNIGFDQILGACHSVSIDEGSEHFLGRNPVWCLLDRLLIDITMITGAWI